MILEAKKNLKNRENGKVKYVIISKFYGEKSKETSLYILNDDSPAKC